MLSQQEGCLEIYLINSGHRYQMAVYSHFDLWLTTRGCRGLRYSPYEWSFGARGASLTVQSQDNPEIYRKDEKLDENGGQMLVASCQIYFSSECTNIQFTFNIPFTRQDQYAGKLCDVNQQNDF